MDEATYKAFWVGYGVRYAIGAAAVVFLSTVLHAVVLVALNRWWGPVRCERCQSQDR